MSPPKFSFLRLGRSASPPESSASAGRSSEASRPAAASSSGFKSSTTRVLRRGAVGLISLPLLVALSNSAAAQTLSISPATIEVTEAEGDGAASIVKSSTVSISSGTGPIHVRLQSQDGTATRASSDYQVSFLNHSFIDQSILSRATHFVFSSVVVYGDSEDEPDETFTIVLEEDPDNALPQWITISSTANTVTYTIIDSDPTVVSLAKVSSATSINEGGKVEFTVTLGRALVAGETIDVPLSISGTGVTTGDWSLAKKSGGSLNTGVTLRDTGTATPKVRFSGAGAQTATLELTATADGTPEGSETINVALGPDGDGANGFDHTSLGTNVGGGADPHGANNDFDIMITAQETTAPRVTSITRQRPSSSPTASDSLTWRVTFNEAVRNVDGADFQVSGTSASLVAGPVPGTNAYDVLARGGNLAGLTGTVTLSFTSGQNIQDTSGNTLTNTTPTGTNDNTFEVDNTAPRVTSYTRQTPSSEVTDADSLTWRVTFNEAVRNVDAGDFRVTNTGTTGTLSVAPVPGTNAYDVTASGGKLAGLTGTVTLVFTENQNIEDASRNALTQYAPTGTGDNFFVLNNPVVITISGGSAVTEGIGASFTVNANPAPTTNLDVSVAVTQSGDFVASSNRGAKTVTIAANATSKVYTVPTENDMVDEANGSVTVTVNNGQGYTVGSTAAATVTVNDDDIPDITAPRVTSITRQTPSSEITDADSLTWRVLFNEAVQNVDRGDFQVDGATATLAVAQVGATNAYDVTASGGDLAGLVSTTVTLSFTSGQNIQDTSGNMLTNTTPTGTNHNTFVVSNYTVSPLEIYEGERLTFTIAGFQSNYNLGVRINTSTSTATRNSDYNLYAVGGQTNVVYHAIPQGSTRQFDIEAVADSDGSEGDETIVVEFGQDGGGYLTGGTVLHTDTVTLKDGARPNMSNDGVTISPTSLALTELGAANLVEKTYTVVLNTDPTADVTITVANGDSTAVEVDTDSGASGNQNTLTFTHGNSGNWNTAQTVTVRALNDGDGANESFNLTHSATATGSTAPYDGITIDPVAITTTDAGHGVVISESSLSVAENDETATYTVVLKSQPGGPVTITPTSGATTTATVSPPSLSFTNSDWNTPQTVTITGKGAGSTSISHGVTTDTTDYPTSTTIPAVAVTVTAVAQQVLDLSTTSSPANEGTAATLRIAATGASADQTVAGGTALLTFSGEGIASSDYSVAAQNSFSLTGGPPPAGTATVNLAADSTDEPNETLVVGWQNLPSGYRAGTTASILIIDQDPTTVTLGGGGTVAEDGSNSADVTVTLSRNLVAGETVTVPLAITGAGITAGDYAIAPSPGSNLNSGVTLTTSTPHSASQPAMVFTGHGTNTVQVATLRLTAVQDNRDEGASEALSVGFGSGNRAVTSNLDRASGTGPGGATTAGTATVTITDDDTPAVTIVESGGSTSVSEASGAGRTDSYTVALATQPTHSVTITPTSSNTAAATVSSALTFTTSNWSAPQTVTVTGVDDNVDQTGNRSVTISHSATSTDGKYNSISIANVTATVVDNDGAGVTINESDGVSVSEASGAGNTDTYTVVLDTQPTHSVTITPTSSNTAAATVSGTLTFTTSNWNTPQPVTLTGVDDNTDNPGGGREVSISHGASSTDPSYTITSAGSVEATVRDDDATTVTLSGAGSNMEEGESRTFTITLGRGLVDGETLTAPLAFGGTATRGTDYTMTGTVADGVQYNNLNSGGATVVFTGPESGATATTATITLSATADSTTESTAETVDINFGTITNTGLTGAGGVTRTDSLGVFTISDATTSDMTAPRVTSIVRRSPSSSPTDADSLTWRVTFNEAVQNVDAADFQVSGANATLAVARVGATNAYDVTASGGNLANLDATVTLSFASGQNIQDTAGNPLATTTPTGDNDNSFVVDNTSPPPPPAPSAVPVVSITAGETINEGEGAIFTLTATPAPATGNPIIVNLMLSARGEVISSGETGNRSVTIDDSGTATVTVSTEDDAVQEEDGSVTATVQDGTGYTIHASNSSASVTVRDNELAELSVPSLTVAAGESASYAVTLADQPMGEVTVTIAVTPEQVISLGRSASNTVENAMGLVVTPSRRLFTRSNWNVPQEVVVRVAEDAHGASLVLRHIVSGDGLDGRGDTHLPVTVEADTKTVDASTEAAQGMEAWRLRFGRTLSHQVADALQDRLSPPLPLQPGSRLTVAGEAVSSPPALAENDRVLSKALGFENVSPQLLVEGSSFSFAPQGEAGAPQLAFWGQGAFSSFSGQEEELSLDGDVTTLLLGADWSTGRWQAGAALSRSWGSGSYDGDDNAEGEISTSLTGLFPYGRYALTPRLGLWATAGYGWGDLSLSPDGNGEEYKPDTTMTMVALGMDGLLLDGGSEGVSLTTTADLLSLNTTSDEVEGLESSEGKISRFRLGLEATRPFPLANGSSFLPTMEMGIRQDGGDAETGFGMDLGAGIAWKDPQRGISAELKGRTLLAHAEEEFQDQGLALSFSWDPSPSNRGPYLSMGHAMGATATADMDALFNPATFEQTDGNASNGQQFAAELAYGFPVHNDRLTLTPAVAMALSPTSRNYGLLWSLAPYTEQLEADPWQFSIEAERQEHTSPSTPTDHSLKLRFSTLL